MTNYCLNDYEPRIVPSEPSVGCMNCLFDNSGNCAVLGLSNEIRPPIFSCSIGRTFRLVHRISGEEVDPINLVQRAKAL